jgi:hypothetical protein
MSERMGNAIDKTDAEITAFLREAFEDNYERLRVENGRGLSADGKEFAWNQVLLYWKKLREIAKSITDTEVHLTLPNQETPKGRHYAIEGVVDIVREEGYTVMYDIKSHAADYVRQNKELYERQLNVYAHIWRMLRGEDLVQLQESGGDGGRVRPGGRCHRGPPVCPAARGAPGSA